ncbi:MAG: peptidoglycan-binding protein [Syntrophomonadaceae bacterium]|nr:peptidoglycan-binding protein [Syntrophomonadaceae bacterium]MDD3898974.1 peptidoglycan-binding protein [Syntrophomonadaceae bacterium]MDD4562737.1 peptidoglycan-binding protein [Syntrophomonadaceae bacterium]
MIYASRFLRYDEDLMQGPDVLVLQEKLVKKGYQVSTNGVYDKSTEKAVLRFQQTSGLRADGIAGPETWNLLSLGIDNSITAERSTATRPSILINLDKRRLTFTRDGSSTTYPVAVGKPSTPSPIGNWVIVQKSVDPGGPFGVRWMRLSVPWGGYGIHGTNNPASIGRAVSHGCIRMYNKDVIKIYDLTPIGTQVNIIGHHYTGRILKEGDSGEDVKQLQRDLKKLGYYNSSIDGIFGPKTRQAVMAFQADQGLAVDGVVGPYTYFALLKALDVANKSYEP